MASIGMNLANVSYWSTEEPFIDRFKTSAPWKANAASGSTVDPAGVTFDASGNPIAIPKGAATISTSFAVDPPAESPIDTYVLTYSGTATIKLAGAKILSQSAGQIKFEVTDPSRVSVSISVSAMSTTDPLHDVHVVRTDQVDLFKSGEIFNPDFVTKASNWDVLRFMDWGNTNASQTVSWADHAVASDASWGFKSNADGVPLEVMVKLANEAHTDMWWNVPTQADDTYVTNALAYIHDHLDPSLKVHVEYSNEVWNWGFDAARYARAEAAKLWGNDANHDGTIDPTDKAETITNGYMVYYGYRSAQIASIAHQVFGTEGDARVVDVLSAQTTWSELTTYTLKGIALANAGGAGGLFDEYAVTTYFGMTAKTDADKATILGWANGGKAGLDAAFKELASGGALSTDHSLAAAAQNYAEQGKIAQAQDLHLIAYEGGASLIATPFTGADQDIVTAFFAQMMNDPRMGTLYTQMSHDFTAAGGTTLIAYADTGNGGQYGYWGTLDSIYDGGSARYDALLQLQSEPTASIITLAAKATAAAAATAGSLLVLGTSGADTLTGTIGDDTIDGGAGADRMSGGAGNDVYIVDNADDKVVESIDGGIDEVRTNLTSYTLGANVETLRFGGTGAFTGSGNVLDNLIVGGAGDDTLTGNGGNDTLLGGGGDDLLRGGVGADRMAGGTGNDSYFVDDIGDQVIENGGEGNDTVTASIDYVLPANVEALRLQDGAIAGTGNALDNLITGNSAANRLDGGAGADTIVGGDGDDTLLGGDGNDSLTGGSGNDLLNGGAGNDEIGGGDGDDRIYGGGGHDLLRGGAGADRFIFATGDLSADRATSALILDFTRADGDKIDLSAIDANIATKADEAFSFLGVAAFTRHAGELVLQQNGAYWDVMGDTNGDGRADFVLEFSSKAGVPIASDFIL